MESKIKLHNAVWASLVINLILNIFAWKDYSNYFDNNILISLVVVPLISFIPFIPAGLLGIWGVTKTMSALNKKIAGID